MQRQYRTTNSPNKRASRKQKNSNKYVNSSLVNINSTNGVSGATPIPRLVNSSMVNQTHENHYSPIRGSQISNRSKRSIPSQRRVTPNSRVSTYRSSTPSAFLNRSYYNHRQIKRLPTRVETISPANNLAGGLNGHQNGARASYVAGMTGRLSSRRRMLKSSPFKNSGGLMGSGGAGNGGNLGNRAEKGPGSPGAGGRNLTPRGGRASARGLAGSVDRLYNRKNGHKMRGQVGNGQNLNHQKINMSSLISPQNRNTNSQPMTYRNINTTINSNNAKTPKTQNLKNFKKIANSSGLGFTGGFGNSYLSKLTQSGSPSTRESFPTPMFERIQEMDDLDSGQVKDFLNQAARNLLDSSEVMIYANSLMRTQPTGKAPSEASVAKTEEYIHKFNAKMRKANHSYRQIMMELLEDLKDDLGSGGLSASPRRRPEAFMKQRRDQIDFLIQKVNSRRIPQGQLRGQLSEIAVCCDPELTALTSRSALETRLVDQKRSALPLKPLWSGGTGGQFGAGFRRSQDAFDPSIPQNPGSGRMKDTAVSSRQLDEEQSREVLKDSSLLNQIRNHNRSSKNTFRSKPSPKSSQIEQSRERENSSSFRHPSSRLNQQLQGQTTPRQQKKRKEWTRVSTNRKQDSIKLSGHKQDQGAGSSGFSDPKSSQKLLQNHLQSFGVNQVDRLANRAPQNSRLGASRLADSQLVVTPSKSSHGVDMALGRGQGSSTHLLSKQSPHLRSSSFYSPPKQYKTPNIIEVVASSSSKKHLNSGLSGLQSSHKQPSPLPQALNNTFRDPDHAQNAQTTQNPQSVDFDSMLIAGDNKPFNIGTNQSGVKRSMRKQVSSNESATTLILNKDNFFRNYKSTKVDLPDVMCNKLDINDQSTKLILTGCSGTTTLNIKGPQTSFNQHTQEIKSTTLQCLPKNHLILQEPNTNNLELYVLGISGLALVATMQGVYEAGVPAEDLHCYRYSTNNYYFLWRSGQDNLSIVDVDTFETVETLKKFWSYKRMSSMPIAACANRTAERVVGISLSAPESFIVHYYEDSPEQSVYFCGRLQEVVPSLYRVNCLEVSESQSYVLMAGDEARGGQLAGPCVKVVRFDKHLEVVSGGTVRLIDVDYGTPRRIKRIKGSDVFVIGCDRHFSVVELVNNSTGQLVFLASLVGIHEHEICDFDIRGKYMYSKALNEPFIKITEFDLNEPGANPATFRSSIGDSRLVTRSTEPLNNSAVHGEELKTSSFGSRYSNFSRIKLRAEGMTNLEKVVTSVNGRRLYAGGKGLHCFKFKGSGFVPENIDKSESTCFYGLRTTNSGNVVIQEPMTNNMIVLTGKSFQVVTVLKGRQKCMFNSTYLRNPHFTGEDNTVVWFCGTSTIAVVDFNNLKPLYIENFIPYFDARNFGVATRCVSKDQGRAIFAIYVMNNSFYIATYFKGHKPKNKKVKEILPNFGKVYALELNLTRSVIFCGGCTKRDSKKRTFGTLAAINFDSSFRVINELRIDQFDVSACTSIKRFHDRDDLAVGCLRCLLIVEFNGRGFEVKNMVDNLHSYTLTDIWIFGNRIFSVCRKDEYISEIAYDYRI